MLSNPDLTKLIDNLIGESWRTNPNDREFCAPLVTTIAFLKH